MRLGFDFINETQYRMKSLLRGLLNVTLNSGDQEDHLRGEDHLSLKARLNSDSSVLVFRVI